MKKLFSILILSILMLGQAQAQFICKDIGYNALYPQHDTFYKCREESTIDFNTWYN